MKEINVTIGQWYVVEGAAGDTITNPSTCRAIATVEDGKQASFYATSAVVVASSDSIQVHRATFNSAPAKLKLLGLLGGGNKVDPLMKYAECVTVADMLAVNADYKNDLTPDGEWLYPLPKLKNSSGAFARSDDFVSFDADLPELTYGVSMFRNMPKMEKFKGSLKVLINGQEMFCYSYSFTDFDSTLERLDEGLYMFMGCQLNKESALKIFYSVPAYTDRKHNLHLGIHIDHQTDEEVATAIADAETKGWNVGVQWNGTATAQTASTFGLRKPPIYAKLGTVERPDGTTEQVLDWGHYVTDWEANGYREFASVEEAKEYFNIIDEA